MVLSVVSGFHWGSWSTSPVAKGGTNGYLNRKSWALSKKFRGNLNSNRNAKKGLFLEKKTINSLIVEQAVKA